MEGLKKMLRIGATALSIGAADAAVADERKGEWKTEIAAAGQKQSRRKTETAKTATETVPKNPLMEVEGMNAVPPQAFTEMCERLVRVCEKQNILAKDLAKRERKGDTVDMLELRAINERVNNSLKPVSDMDQHGEIDRWDIPSEDGAGDCEDYVLLKRELLIKKGWKPSDLLITVVNDENGEGHAVLTVRLEAGDFVLDNKQGEVLLWHEVETRYGYQFKMRQSPMDPKIWRNVKRR